MQKTHNVMATLQEADRQFTIETTPVGQLPNDAAAIPWIDKAIALMPHSKIPYVGTNDDPGLIEILENRGRYPLLIVYLKKAAADPKLASDPLILLPLADSLQRMGPQAEATKEYAAALAAFDKSYATTGSTFDAGSGVLDRARAEYYGGQRAAAIKDFQTIVTTRPELSADAENDLAYFESLDKSDLPGAKKMAVLAVAEARREGDDATTGTYIDTLAWVDHQSGDDADALICEQEAASLTPLQPDVQYHLGEICRAEGQYLQAQVAYTRAIKLNPFFPEARAALQSLPQTPQSSGAY